MTTEATESTKSEPTEKTKKIEAKAKPSESVAIESAEVGVAAVEPKPAVTISTAPKLDTTGFVPNDSSVPENFVVMPWQYLVYDFEHAAPHGALQGTFRRIEESVIGGQTHHYLIMRLTRPCAALMQTRDGVVLVRAQAEKSFVAVPLFHPPQNLRALLTNTHWVEMQIRPGDQGNWAFLFSTTKEFGKGDF
jgi:hypothetical protein